MKHRSPIFVAPIFAVTVRSATVRSAMIRSAIFVWPRVFFVFMSALVFMAALGVLAATASAQMPTLNPSSATNSLYGSVTTQKAIGEALPLSLDEAVRRGLEHNLQMKIAEQNQRIASGEKLQAINYLMPTLTYQGRRSRNQLNLEAEGFRTSTLASFPPGFVPPGEIKNFQPLVTFNVVSAQVNLQQSLSALRSLELYRAAKESLSAVNDDLQSSRQDVIQTVADTYLLALADAANVANTQSLLGVSAEILRDATLEHQAGTAAKLDELRARVAYQQQQQMVVASENSFDKEMVLLNREIGLPVEQSVQLTDTTPYAELGETNLPQALRQAYADRQDYRRSQSELRAAQYERKAAAFERLPSLRFNGNYGVTGTVGGIYHGTFLAEGELTVPIFSEAKFRGDKDVAQVGVRTAIARLGDLKGKIEAQVRDDLLDVTAANQLVNVARSNVDLAQASLSDARDRFKNGVDDDLAVVQAQSSVASGQSQLVNSLYRYNRAKLSLARHLGIIEQQYRAYLGE